MSDNISQIDARDVYRKIQAGDLRDSVLLDVRTPGEFLRERIKDSINLPVDDVQVKAQDILPDKDKTIYVYCMSGSRSAIAAQILKSLGYKNVFDIISGIMAWRVYKLPLEK